MDPIIARVVAQPGRSGYWPDAFPAPSAAGDGNLLCNPRWIERRSRMQATLFLGPFHRQGRTRGDG